MRSADTERLLDSLGMPGKLQCMSFLFLCINLWIVMTNHMSSVFFTAKTDYSCKIDRNVSYSPEADKCYISLRNTSIKCTVWNYNLPDRETTIISEVIINSNAIFNCYAVMLLRCKWLTSYLNKFSVVEMHIFLNFLLVF